MDKNYLKENQPIVYQTLKNSFSNNKTSHAYIVAGAKGLPLLDIAKLMAASFVCNNKDDDGLACLECVNCNKVDNNQYGDLLIIEGSELKNDAVLDLQKEFSKSSLEDNGNKIYIINLIEKAPIASLNKLLKFIEEPNSNTKAIFTSNSVSSILPTIVSRCQVIKLKEFTNKELVSYLLDKGILKEDAYLISRISNDATKNLEIVKEDYFKEVKDTLDISLSYIANKDDYYFVYMENEGLKQIKGHEELYLDMLQACFLEALVKKEDNTYVSKFLDESINHLSKNYKNIEWGINSIALCKKETYENTNKGLAYDKLFINLLKG